MGPHRASDSELRHVDLALSQKAGSSGLFEVTGSEGFGKITMVTGHGMPPLAHVGPRWEAGAIVPVGDDYRAAERPIISQLNGNRTFRTQSRSSVSPAGISSLRCASPRASSFSSHG